MPLHELWSSFTDSSLYSIRTQISYYIHTNYGIKMFDCITVCSKLMVVLNNYINNVQNAKQRDSLFKAMKSLQYLFKFIIRSRVLFAAWVSNNSFLLQCRLLIKWAPKYSQLTSHSSPVRARYGVAFVSSKSDLTKYFDKKTTGKWKL